MRFKTQKSLEVVFELGPPRRESKNLKEVTAGLLIKCEGKILQ